ncbi:hypothetical protein ACVIW2_008484 [Bradyrhizobium huanghuaihaiense]|uniref:Uncharacterized protein n=1 Tax=Bradyrhizobium huanghuaihaiense TaxID=990078 RepID=A0A562QWV5_9BRAD|nr:hypothetical protein IQ16_07140 [Bradyrhizobium huanghuaihaiense]
MPVLLTLALVRVHDFKLGLGVTRILMLPFQVDDHRLLLGQPPLPFNHLTFQLPQLVQDGIVEHRQTPRGRTVRNGPSTTLNAGAVGGCPAKRTRRIKLKIVPDSFYVHF